MGSASDAATGSASEDPLPVCIDQCRIESDPFEGGHAAQDFAAEIPGQSYRRNFVGLLRQNKFVCSEGACTAVRYIHRTIEVAAVFLGKRLGNS